jgi:hypothetical protein
MAARPSGSGADALVLYNAKDWLGKVHVMDRDCGVATHLLEPDKCVADETCSYLRDSYLGSESDVVSTTLRGDIMGGIVLSKKWDREKGCVESKGSVSIMGTGVHLSYGSTADNTYRALLVAGQPFSFAGTCNMLNPKLLGV